MSRTPSRNVRINDERWERWQAVAADVGASVSALLIEAMERHIATVRPGMVAPARGSAAVVHAPPRRERSTPCEHRVPVGAHCSRGCDP